MAWANMIKVDLIQCFNCCRELHVVMEVSINRILLFKIWEHVWFGRNSLFQLIFFKLFPHSKVTGRLRNAGLRSVHLSLWHCKQTFADMDISLWTQCCHEYLKQVENNQQNDWLLLWELSSLEFEFFVRVLMPTLYFLLNIG